MNTTRRNWFQSLLAGVASIFTASQVVRASEPVGLAKPLPVIIRAGDPGSMDIEVYDIRTGKRKEMVQAVCVDQGWIDVILTKDGKILFDRNYNALTERLLGPWAIRKSTFVHISATSAISDPHLT